MVNQSETEPALLAVSELCQKLQMNILFNNDGVYLLHKTDPERYKLGANIGSLRNGLYYLYDTFLINHTTTKFTTFQEFTKKKNMVVTKQELHEISWSYRTNSYAPNPVMLYHCRLGHMCKEYMKQGKSFIRGMENLQNVDINTYLGGAYPCWGCIGKINRYPKSLRGRGRARNKHADKDLTATVATDTFGPFPANYFGFKYGQLFIHLNSRKVWLYGMRKREDFPQALQEFLSDYKNLNPNKSMPIIGRTDRLCTFQGDIHHQLNIIRSDRAKEFSGADARSIYAEFGIRHIQTVAHASYMNGFAERAIQTINKIASAQLVHAKFTEEEYEMLYWQSLKHAVNVYNFAPHKGLKFHTPHEAWTGHKPHIDWLRTFGCTAFEYLDTSKRANGKRSRRFRIGIYLGMEETTDIRHPAMRIYVPSANKILIRKSVITDETMSHSEKRLGQLLQGSHYITLNENEQDKFEIPSIPPTFEGVGADWSNEDGIYIYQGDNLVPAETDTNMEETAPDEDNEAMNDLQGHRYLTRSKGPPPQSVTLHAYKTNAKFNETITLVEVFANTATILVDHTWAATVNAKDLNITPKEFDNPTIAQAVLREDWPLWLEAIKKELAQLEARGTWTEVDGRKISRKPLGTKLVLKIKRDARTGEIDKYKARLTVKGFAQVKGLDYKQTTSPVTTYATFKFLCAHALKYGRKLKTIDFAGAFLYPFLKEEIYIKPPKQYKPKSKEWTQILLRLRKSLYGLKQASREWYLALCDAFKKVGFEQAKAELDNCLFYHAKADIYLCVHVDDCYLSYNDEAKVAQIMEQLKGMNFEFSMVEELKKGLGLSIARDAHELFISQPTYVDHISAEYAEQLVQFNRTIKTPIVDWETNGDKDEQKVDETQYRGLLGCLSHLARMTRPDILLATFHFAQFSHSPKERHWKGLSRIVAYLQGTKYNGIRFSVSKTTEDFEFYVDADWGGDLVTRRSTTGYLIKYLNGPLIAVSRRQRNVTLSSTEAEYCAFTDAAKDIIWVSRLAQFFGEPFPSPALLRNDNMTAQNIANGKAELKRMKHIDAFSKHTGIRYHWIKELIEAGLIRLVHEKTETNQSDLMTKPLKRIIHERLSKLVMNTDRETTKYQGEVRAMAAKVLSPNVTTSSKILECVQTLGV